MPQELVRVDRVAALQEHLPLADALVASSSTSPSIRLRCSSVTYRKFPDAAGRVEHLDLAQLVVERFEFLDRAFAVARLAQRTIAAVRDGVPFRAKRLDDRRHHQPLDVGPRRVVGAQLVPLDRVRARSSSVPKIAGSTSRQSRLGRLDQQVELVARQRAAPTRSSNSPPLKCSSFVARMLREPARRSSAATESSTIG